MTISRRATFRLAAGAAALASLSPDLLKADAQPVAGGFSEAELDALDAMLGEEAAKSSTFSFEAYTLDKELRGELVRSRVVPALRGTRLSAKGEVLTAVPVADEDSPNYNHIAGRAGAEPFKLNAGVLQRMADANSFTPAFSYGLAGSRAQARIVIFGLRGCKLAPGATAAILLDEVELVEAPIDHRGKQCVMGVWDRNANKISVFTASTAPHLLYMQMYRINLHLLGKIMLDDATVNSVDKISAEEIAQRRLPWTANMLGQGLHMMQVGRHQNKYPNLLVQHTRWYGPVLRASKALGYTVNDWDRTYERVGDNIHPCWPVPTWLMDFASAGCNLIEGKSKVGPDYDGPFGEFLRQIRKPADARDDDAGDWKAYFYMLLSGREARLHAQVSKPDPDLRRLRFGSSGLEVADLQRRAFGLSGAAADGVFGLRSHARLIAWQGDRRLPTDGVVTPSLLASL